MKQLFSEPDVHIAALCDINDESDYSMFYYGGTAGLKPASELVRQQYGEPCRHIATTTRCSTRRISTPSWWPRRITRTPSSRWPPSARASTVLRETAVPHGLRDADRHRGSPPSRRRDATGEFRPFQRGHPPDVRMDLGRSHRRRPRGACLDQHGARRWTNLSGRPTDSPPVPAGFDWERWLDPVLPRPDHPDYAGRLLRRLVAIRLRHDRRLCLPSLGPGLLGVEAGLGGEVPGRGQFLRHQRRRLPGDVLDLRPLPGGAGMSPVRITWYEGGLMPPCPAELEPGRSMGDNGILFVGTERPFWAEAGDARHGSSRKAKCRLTSDRPRPCRESLDTTATGSMPARAKASPAPFDYSGPLTEFSLMGNVALRAGKPLDFDWKSMQVTNVPEANQYVKPELREGRTL